MAEEKSQKIRLIVSGRRKPGMTRHEYADHRYEVHAAVTYGGPDKSLNPILYTQNHVIDAALGAPAAKPNENHPWLVGRDDVTECVFRDGRQMWDYFGSEHVKDVVAKDIPFFADVGGLCWLVSARDTSVFDADPAGGSLGDGQDAGFVGFYFLASPPSPVAQLPHEASSLIAKTFQTHAGAEIIHGELYKVLPEYDLSGYFGKGNEGIPKFAAVVKLFLKGRGSIATVRQAQSIIENNPTIGNSVDLGRSFIVFTNRMLVFAEHKPFDPDAKPDWNEML